MPIEQAQTVSAVNASVGMTARSEEELVRRPPTWWVRLFSNSRSLTATGILFFMLLLALAAGTLAPYNYKDQLRGRELVGPCASHFFGTDSLGRDILSRVMYGARVSLLIGISATVLSLLIGVTLGLCAGYFGGKIDAVLMRITDTVAAFPSLLLAIAITALYKRNPSMDSDTLVGDFSFWVALVVMGLILWAAAYVIVNTKRRAVRYAIFLPFLFITWFVKRRIGFNVEVFHGNPSFWILLFALGVVGWTGIARVVRAQVLTIKTLDYVTAALALGGDSWRIMFRHVLPNCWSPIIVLATLAIGGNILGEAGLSFLGLGIQEPFPSWGGMLSDAKSYFETQWWLAVFPGTAIVLTVLSFNLLGDGLRDALDPKAMK